MENKRSPIVAIKQILGSGKITFICIMFTIAAVAAFGKVLNNHLDFNNVEIFGQPISLGEFIGGEGVEILNIISNTIFIISIIGMLPKILVAVAFWMIKVGSKEGEKNTKISIIGFNFFKINFMYKAVTEIIGLIVSALLGAFIIYITFSASSSPNPTVLIIEVVLLALILGYFFFFFKYYTNYTAMLIGATQTIRSNINLVIKSNQVIIFNYIVAVYLIISSLTKGIWGIIAGVCEALCIIFVNRCFADFNGICGYAKSEESKAMTERLTTDPSLEKVAKAIGVARKYSSDPLEQNPPITKVIINMMFGLSVAHIDDITPYEPTADVNNTASSSQSVQNQSDHTRSIPTYTRALDITEELNIRLLPLFEGCAEITNKRYSIIGNRSFSKTTSPVAPRTAQVAIDSISEKKILRLAFENNSPEKVNEIKFKVIPKTNESASLGVFKDVTIRCNADTGEYFGAEYGLILPDNATCGTVKVTYIEFADGMFRDKEGEEFYFSTDEKTEFDTKLYLLSISKR